MHAIDKKLDANRLNTEKSDPSESPVEGTQRAEKNATVSTHRSTAIVPVSSREIRPSDKWENLAELLRAGETDLGTKLAYCQINPPDPVNRPITGAVVATYISCLELELATIRGGSNGLKTQFLDRPGLTREILELESWILRRKSGVARSKFGVKDEEALGDWFVSKMGYSYSQAKRMLQDLRDLSSGRGAPNKRPETLKVIDARISNNWSYSRHVSTLRIVFR